MSQNTLARARIVVDGNVQGVGFRYKIRRMARNQRLAGYAKNLEDGTVEIVCEGTRSSIESFTEEIRMMKEPIAVERADVTFEEPKKEFKTFKIVVGELAEEMVEGFSTGSTYFEIMLSKQDQMLSKQDQMLSKQDQMLSKQDQMLSKQDQMLSKQDQMLSKQDQTIGEIRLTREELKGEIRGLREDLKTFIDDRLKKIERDIASIKSKVGMA